MKIKLGDVLSEINEKTTVNDQYPVLTASKDGIKLQSEYFNKDVASQDNTGYKIIKRGQYTYRAMSDTGKFYPNKLDCVDIGIVSPAYPVFEISKKELLDPDYLKYYFKSDSFQFAIAGFAQGSTRTSVKFPKIKTVEIILPSLEDQRRIVKKIDTINDLITIQNKQLNSLDELIKARFVELFGIPGTNEKGWELTTLGRCCEINPKKNNDERLINGLEVSFVPMPAVSEKGEIDTSGIKLYDDVKTGFTYFSERDVLFAKITPCMENGKGAVAVNLRNGIGFGSTEFHVLRPLKNKSNPYWIYVLTILPLFRIEAENNMTGSAGQKRVPSSFLNDFKIALPPIELQNQFEEFYKQLDKSKFVIQQSLNKTQKLFDSLMQQYFG